MQEVCEKLMVDEITLKNFVQHREFLALKAQKREAVRNTLPDINWKEENEVESLTARQMNNLHVSGSKAALVARALDFSHTGTRSNERNSSNDSDTELLSSDSESDSGSRTSTSENSSDDSEMDGFQLSIHMRYYVFQMTTSNK